MNIEVKTKTNIIIISTLPLDKFHNLASRNH